MRVFLEAIWANAHGRYGEVRSMRDGKVRQDFFDLNDPEALLWAQARAFLMSDGDGWDVYYGVLPREEKVGTTAAVFPETSVLWADVDAKRVSLLSQMGREPDLRHQKTVALQTINQFPTPPQVIVDSGRGYHGYWLLDKPEPLDRAQAVMAYIADQIGGDRVHDAPRILRVPGTHNFKQDPPLDVRLIKLEGRRIRLADLEGYLPIPIEPRKMKRRPVDGPKEDLPSWLVELIRDGAPQGARSEQSFRALIWLIRYGRSYDEALDLFIDSPDGIGAKYAEKDRDGDRWFRATFEAAEAAA